MPPKRSRATDASQAVSSSQPEPPQRTTRASGRKRRHSDASNVSEASQASSTAVQSTTKRRKKGRLAAELDAEVIVEEEDQVMQEPACDPPESEVIEVSQSRSQSSSKTVHFSQPLDDEIEKSTNTNLTPHPRKTAIMKRRTMSPAPKFETKRLKTSRTSLPASLSQDEEPTTTISEMKFAPLRAVLDERIRRLKEQKAAAEEYDGNADLDEESIDTYDEMLVLDAQEEITYPQLPTPNSSPSDNGQYTKIESMYKASTQTASAAWEKERRTWHDAILALEAEANEAKTKLDVLTIQVETLGFAAEGDKAAVVLQSIQESFDKVRSFLDAELPGATPEDARNQDLVDILIANVTEFAERLRNADKELFDKDTLSADLSTQVNGLLDHLAEKEFAFGERQERWETSVERLRDSLEGYRAEETRLTNIIAKMDEEHRTTVCKMNKERQEAVQELEREIDAEREKRGDAERLAEDRRIMIENLEKEVKTKQSEHDALREELDDAKATLEDEIQTKEEVQATLTQKNAEVDNLESRVDRLEEELEALNDQLTTLRQQYENERNQREAAETELDVRVREIDELNTKLQQSGTQANELRLKSHELQTKNQKKIEELEGQMSERDAQYQEDMAAEVQRREYAEELAQGRLATITELEEQLEAVETQMRDMLAERDERIADLEGIVSQRDDEIQELREDLRVAENRVEVLETEKLELQQGKSSLEGRVENEAEQMLQLQNDMQSEIDHLKEQIREKQGQMVKVEQKLRESEKYWEELDEARVEEIESMKGAATDTTATIAELNERIAQMSGNFKAYIRRSTDTIVNLQDQLRVATATADEQAEIITGEGQSLLDELEALAVPGEMQSANAITTSKKARGRKRKVKDSGIGLDEDGDESMMIEA